jgi:hypothetical protein
MNHQHRRGFEREPFLKDELFDSLEPKPQEFSIVSCWSRVSSKNKICLHLIFIFFYTILFFVLIYHDTQEPIHPNNGRYGDALSSQKSKAD